MIKAEQQDLFRIQNGDTKVLRKVLEAESTKRKDALALQASVDNFRFQQGEIQMLLEVIKLLP